MPKFMRNPTLHIISTAVLCMTLTACLETEASSNTATSAPKLKSFMAAKHNVPFCYAVVTKNLDSVVTFKRDKKGNITGKTFGVKKAPRKTALQPFEQEFQGHFAGDEIIKVNVRTEFEDARIKGKDTITLQADSILFGKVTMKSGRCKRLINNFLERDIKRRRKAERAALDVF